MALFGAFLFGANTAAAQPTTLDPSILLFDEAILDRGPLLVDRAVALGSRRVQVVVKVRCRLTEKLKVTEYGLLVSRPLMWQVPKHPKNFVPIDDASRRDFTERLAKVFRRAAKHGLDLAVLPHLDAYGEVDAWRNDFDFDPLAKRAGESYASAVIKPIVDALNRSIEPGTRVQFSLSGEMGRSFFSHPKRYAELAATIRRHFNRGSLKLGVSLNHSDVASRYQSTAKQRVALQRLFADLDFVGLSHYRPFTPPPRVEHFSEACSAFIAALVKQGVTLPAETPLHFSEIAIGGAPPRQGEATPVLAARQPWEGTGEPNRSPWRSREMQAFRRAYHNRLLEFLAEQPARRRVAAAYLWSENSWDPQGIDGRRFADEQITEAIRRHNAKLLSTTP